MFKIVDNTFRDLRERSLNQWLSEMEAHDDITVRGGVKLCREYLAYLEEQNRRLLEENELKNSYLRKLARKNRT